MYDKVAIKIKVQGEKSREEKKRPKGRSKKRAIIDQDPAEQHKDNKTLEMAPIESRGKEEKQDGKQKKKRSKLIETPEGAQSDSEKETKKSLRYR